MENNSQYMKKDTIDLREVWEILVKRKILIISLTLLITSLGIVYTMTAKPVYQGSVTLELGQIINEQFIDGKYSSLKVNDLDNIYNLKMIVSKTTGVSTSVPKSTKLLTLSATDYSKPAIKQKLEKAINYILNRHQELAKLYAGPSARVKMTQIVRELTIGEQPVKPKKKLIIIVSFIAGLMFSVFLAFFLEFLQVFKKRHD